MRAIILKSRPKISIRRRCKPVKNLLLIFAILAFAPRSPAQTNEPVRLALVSESGETSPAADVLTAELSKNQKIQLLERNEIEKVYREQGLSTGNKDYLKLGQVLGTDGLLILDVVRTAQATNLTARLIAVKPGVVLTDGNFPWPLKDASSWSESVAVYLNTFLPKLSLSAKDAIPISVVNLRSAVSSDEGVETERQLKLLTIQRLSREPQFFVLERQKMQLLSEEKELKSDDSAFWNGSYLLEGIVDQNGYSKETVTINARLTPPKGGVPLLLEASGSRTNLAEVINQLAAKIIEALKINSTVKEWDAADEAAQYLNEAKWALRWGVFPEAQAAAESAWALGKHDMDCAIIRVKAYEVPPDTGGYQRGEITNPDSTNVVIQTILEEAGSNHVWGLTLKEQSLGGIKDIQYISAGKFPDPGEIDPALRALGIYYEFSQTLSPEELKPDSAWYRLGVEDLTVASQVLQHFQFVPESQAAAAEKLADLRALARSVAGWIIKLPAVHDSYFTGDRLVVYDELYHFEESPSIFSLQVEYGYLWQEKPEDCVAVYRQLMGSPVFRYIHTQFWLRDLQTPRLAAWNESDRQCMPQVWNNFVEELGAATNVLWQLEGKALALADAGDENKMAVLFTNLFDGLFENREALVANPVEVLYMHWGVDELVSTKTGNGIVTDIKDSLNHVFYSEYSPKLDAMDQEYQQKTVSAGKSSATFSKQKQYLKKNSPYDFFEFVNVFQERDYSQDQAREIQPLIAAYKSNLVAQSQNAAGMQKGQLINAIAQVGFLERDVDRILNPQSPPPKKVQAPKPVVAKIAALEPVAVHAPEIVTNVITVSKFFAIPLDSLYQLNEGEKLTSSGASITAHHWFEGQLLLDFSYGMAIEWRDDKGVLMNARRVTGDAVAIFNPVTEHWSIIDCPESDETSHIMSQNNFYHRSALLRGELFTCDEKQIKKYDFQNQQWNLLSISDGNNYELFVINGHLYGASQNTIFEIVNGGQETHILASTRRQPPLSALDIEDLGTPVLFEGPDHAVRAVIKNKIFTWIGNDWQYNCDVPSFSSQPQIFEDGVLFRQAGFLNAGYQNGVLTRQNDGTYGVMNSQDEISYLPTETNEIRFCFRPGYGVFPRPGMKAFQNSKPFWKMPDNLLPDLPAALVQSDLYLLEDVFATHAIVNSRHEVLQEKTGEKEDYNAALLCFSRDFPLPQKLFLNFNSPHGCPPTGVINSGFYQGLQALPPAWMFFTSDFLILGREAPSGNIPSPTDQVGDGYKTGIWLIPVSEIKQAITAQKQAQLEQKTREDAENAATTEKAQKDRLLKYDHNHNGIIDPDEKEEALDDPGFIKSELDKIDANKDGWLEAGELIYFDANQNKLLEPKEQAGIEIAQHLLATQLLKKFDANGDGSLDRPEFNDLFQASFGANPRPVNARATLFPDGNHDGKIDLDELESFLKQQTRKSLRTHGTPGAAFSQMLNTDQTLDPQHIFKVVVEYYWQHSGAAMPSP